MKLEELKWAGEGFHLYAKENESVYLCSRLFGHPHCLALSYDEEAWKLLQKHWNESQRSAQRRIAD